jgi:hypothetical protein
LSGNGNSGSLGLSIGNGTRLPTYNTGGYFEFNRSEGDFVGFSYKTPAQSSSSSFTWNIWFYTAETNTDRVMMGNRFGDPTGNPIFIRLSQGDFSYSNPTTSPDTGVGLAINTTINSWNNVCITKNSSSFTSYKNGIQIATANSSTGMASQVFKLGGDGSENFTGSIAVALVYHRALSASEVLQNHQELKFRFGL